MVGVSAMLWYHEEQSALLRGVRHEARATSAISADPELRRRRADGRGRRGDEALAAAASPVPVWTMSDAGWMQERRRDGSVGGECGLPLDCWTQESDSSSPLRCAWRSGTCVWRFDCRSWLELFIGSLKKALHEVVCMWPQHSETAQKNGA